MAIIPITPVGGDNLAALNLAYTNAADGDTLLLSGTFAVSDALSWYGSSKAIHIEAAGATIRGYGGYSGTMVVYGAPIGVASTASYLHWTGGVLMGGMTLQNVASSKIAPDQTTGLTLHVDTRGGHNTFDIPYIGGDAYCISVNLATGCLCNKNRFVHSVFAPATAFLYNAAASTAFPQEFIFDDCDFQGSISIPMFASNTASTGNAAILQATFVNCFWESAFAPLLITDVTSLGATDIYSDLTLIKIITPSLSGISPWWNALDARFQNLGVTAAGYSGTSPFGIHEVCPIGPGSRDDIALNALYASCHDGDTIQLVPNAAGDKTFLIGSMLNWYGSKIVNVEAVGVQLTGYSYTGPIVTYGANTGSTLGPCHWHGGGIGLGCAGTAMILQNVGYSKIEPDVLYGTLDIYADIQSPYNEFSVMGGIAPPSGAPCVQFTFNGALDGDGVQWAWIDVTRFSKTPMDPNNAPVIRVYAQSGPLIYNGPDTLVFDQCSFEGAGSVMFDTPYLQKAVFSDCYWEGIHTLSTSGTIGTLNPGGPSAVNVIFVRPAGSDWWSSITGIVIDAGMTTFILRPSFSARANLSIGLPKNPTPSEISSTMHLPNENQENTNMIFLPTRSIAHNG